ncbi:MAG: AsmA-like C-terminal domain-containing protein, partial [Thermoguttaceae bacterium]|nr:AsmA-like C-terminal domain-containing protein [Thermoguttaceae bacterium]
LTIALRSNEGTAPLAINGLFVDALSHPRGQVDVVAKNRSIDAKLLAATPPSCRPTLTQLHPSGEFDANLRMTFDPLKFPQKPFRIETRLDVRDGSVQYDYFPLPISSIAGTLYMRDGAWIFNGLSGKSGAANLAASGSIASGALIEEITAEVAASFSNRNKEESAAYDDVPYRLNASGGGAVFSDDAVPNSPAPVDLFAALPVPVNAPLKKDAQRFQLTTNVENFPLGEELRAALVKYDKKEEFEKLNLNGKANGQIRVAYRTDSPKLALEFEMRPTQGSTSARPEGFPYEFRDVEGLFVYREGTFIVEGLRARNGRTTLSANVSSQTIPDRGWVLDLTNLRVDQIQIDRDLQSAAPNQALSFLSFLNLSGCFNVDGTMRVVKGGGAQSKPQALWNLRLVAQQNSARPGVKLDAVCGTVKLIGSARENESPIFLGEFNLDSLYCEDLQISNLNGPFYFNGSDLFWGKEAPTVQRTQLYQDAFLRTLIDADPVFQSAKLTSFSGNAWRKTGENLQRNEQTLSRAQVQNQNEAPGFNVQDAQVSTGASLTALSASNDGRRTLQARIFGGYFACDGVFNMQETPTYRLNVSLHEGTLDDATRYFAPGTKPLKGRISARASLTGEGATLATLKGEGDIDVQDAELYELPQIVKIFQILSVKAPEQAAFHSMTVKYDVLGDRLKLSNVLLRGDALTLFGEGWLTIKGQEKLIDLTLNSRLGNPSTQIPVVSDLIGEVGDQITQIRVEGNVNSPVIHQEAAPGVKKAWWNVFPEREPEPTDKAPVERARPIRDAWKKVTGTK